MLEGVPQLFAFCPLLKKSKGNPYLKIPDLYEPFLQMPYEKKIVLPPLRAFLFWVDKIAHA